MKAKKTKKTRDNGANLHYNTPQSDGLCPVRSPNSLQHDAAKKRCLQGS